MEELSTRRRGRTVGDRKCVSNTIRHCYVDLSSWYEFWFARICIDVNVIWLILNLSTTIQLAETVSVAGKVGSQHGPHWKSFFIEIQRQGIILASVCLCKSKMWKSNVKNVFNHFPRWSEVSLIAQSLTGETHQTNLRFDVSIKHFSIVWCFM